MARAYLVVGRGIYFALIPAALAIAAGPEPIPPGGGRDADPPGWHEAPNPERGEPSILCNLNEATSCQPFEYPRVPGMSLLSVGGGRYTIADQFRTASSGVSPVSQVCWWGTYATTCGAEPPGTSDSFRVTYFASNNGVPGSVIASFVQGSGLSVNRRAICDVNSRSSLEYTGFHPSVALQPNTCYFVEVVNQLPDPGTWYWSRSNLVTDNSVFADPASAGYDISDWDQTHGDRAFCLGTSLNVLGTPACLPPALPNDGCAGAQPITGAGTTPFDNSGATQGAEGQNNSACAAAGMPTTIFRDLWYNWTAACPGAPGGSMIEATVTTCGSAQLIDSKLAVYRNSGSTCPTGADLIDCNDDFCSQTPPGDSNIAASVTFNAVVGLHYTFQVGGSFAGAAGPQSLIVSCGPARGSCCLPVGGCVEVDSSYCASVGGVYHGDGTSCGGAYTAAPSPLPLLSLSSPTTISFAQGDDDSASIPIGFAFNFYNRRFMTANVGVNGQIAFGGPLYTYGNTWPIPTHLMEPNGYLAVAADDFLVGAAGGCGSVRYERQGSAGSRRLVVEWTGVCHFDTADSNTFQAVLYEGSNTIEYRYGAMGAPRITPTGGITGPGYIRGIESFTGAGSIDLTGPNGEPTPPTSGSGMTFTYNSDPAGLCTASAPINDACENATPLLPASQTPFTTMHATTDGPAPTTCGTGNTIGSDVWFTYTTCSSGTHTVSTCGNAAFDTVLAVYSGQCGALTQLACLDDSCGLQTSLSWPAIDRETYVIRVGGYLGAQGAGTLGLSGPACPPTCTCDWNQNGFLNSQDFFDFLTSFFAGSADFNADGAVTSQDFFDFLNCFFSGGLPDLGPLLQALASADPVAADNAYQQIYGLGKCAISGLLAHASQPGVYAGGAYVNPPSSIRLQSPPTLGVVELYLIDAIIAGRPQPYFAPILIDEVAGRTPEQTFGAALAAYQSWWTTHQGLTITQLRTARSPLFFSNVSWIGGPLVFVPPGPGDYVPGTYTGVYNCLSWAMNCTTNRWIQPDSPELQGTNWRAILLLFGYDPNTLVDCGNSPCPEGHGPKVILVFHVWARDQADAETKPLIDKDWVHAMKLEEHPEPPFARYWTSKNGATCRYTHISPDGVLGFLTYYYTLIETEPGLPGHPDRLIPPTRPDPSDPSKLQRRFRVMRCFCKF